MIRLTIQGTDQVIAYFNRASQRQVDGLRRAFGTFRDQMAAEVDRLLSGGMLQSVSGALRSAQYATVEDDGHALEMTIGFDEVMAPYGVILAQGVPHSWEIEARSKQALRFEIGGEVVFAKRVTHPPALPKSWIATAIATQYPSLLPLIREEINAGV